MVKQNKKYVHTYLKEGKVKKVYYGAKGYRIAPSTPKGDRYCARSFGQVLKFPKSANNPNSPLSLSRKKWRCVGKRSI